MIEKVLTIGAYGFDADSFVSALQAAGVDLFIDIRARRGMRGPAYAFANAARLQASLSSAGIRYVHVKELAPTEAVRDAQRAADASTGTAKRVRSQLSDTFVSAYREQCLADFESQQFVDTHCTDARRPALFCVEREPRACHRSLVAERLAADLGVPVENLMP